MIRALPGERAWNWTPLWVALVFLWATINVGIVLPWVLAPGSDWGLIADAARRLLAGSNPYADARYVYPPLATLMLSVALIPGSYVALVIAHFLALRAFDRWALVCALASAPFWMDTALGNFTVFYVATGYLALRGSRWAGLIFGAMVLLIPKLPFLPLAMWLLWRRPELRLPALGMAVVVATGNLAVGHLDAWLATAVTFTGEPGFRDWDYGPTRFLGSTWLVVGIPLGAWLTWRDHLGWAGMAVAPYLPPPLFLLLLWELKREHLFPVRLASLW